MKFILIFGPPAVGKMTVGHEIEKITGYKLLHDHMTSDLISSLFEIDSSIYFRLNNIFRYEIFKEAAKSNLKGLIFTHPWAIDEKYDTEFINNSVNIFEKENIDVFYVELEATVDERLKRNKSDFRLKIKPSKRDTAYSEARLLEHDKKFRLNTHKNEFTRKNYLKINSTNMTAEETAQLIKETFKF